MTGLGAALIRALPREGGALGGLTVLAVSGVLLLAATGVALALRASPVGAGPVLEAVDAAVRRTRLREVTNPTLGLLCFTALQVERPGYGTAFLICCFTAFIAGAAASDPLLKDCRLVTVRDPNAWLAGTPA